MADSTLPPLSVPESSSTATETLRPRRQTNAGTLDDRPYGRVRQRSPTPPRARSWSRRLSSSNKARSDGPRRASSVHRSGGAVSGHNRGPSGTVIPNFQGLGLGHRADFSVEDQKQRRVVDSMGHRIRCVCNESDSGVLRRGLRLSTFTRPEDRPAHAKHPATQAPGASRTQVLPR